MHRPTVGIIAVGLLVIAAGLSYNHQADTGLFSGLVRVGLLMIALWLALPENMRPVNWRSVGLFVLLVALPGYWIFRLPPAFKIGLLVASPLLLALFWPKIRQFRAMLLTNPTRKRGRPLDDASG